MKGESANTVAGTNKVARHSRLKITLTGLVVAVLLVTYALKRQYPLGSDISPDGNLRAEYSCSAWGISGLLVGGEYGYAKLHLKTVRTDSGTIVFESSYSGDMGSLDEARERFRSRIPWEIPIP